MFRLERLAQKRIVSEVQHAGGKVIASAPIGVDFSDLFGCQRLELPCFLDELEAATGSVSTLLIVPPCLVPSAARALRSFYLPGQ